jgi:XTP/dITP diphosphohydrolase
LEVDALGGGPGVYSARFAGEGASDEANNEKLLKVLTGIENRRARFRCVLSLVDPLSHTVHFSDGSCEGVIARSARGDDGFGYDPIFLPDGFEGRSFGELSAVEKDRVSHRGRALGALRQSLEALMAPR